MTHFLRDILRQPEELRRAIDHLSSAGQSALQTAAATVRDAQHVYLKRDRQQLRLQFGTCHEARLLWKEGAKSPATAVGTSSFRHGPQEMFRKDARFALWIDGHRMRE